MRAWDKFLYDAKDRNITSMILYKEERNYTAAMR
jgi:hypothetical protein